jgi:hypothetical protein
MHIISQKPMRRHVELLGRANVSEKDADVKCACYFSELFDCGQMINVRVQGSTGRMRVHFQTPAKIRNRQGWFEGCFYDGAI